MFGGREASGEINENLYKLSLYITDGELYECTWTKVDYEGEAPIGRIGHSMGYLPNLNAIAVVGGRNDSLHA